ncbi:MAG: hypothetical protein JSR33_09350 [Proteobacteria bacterium]|nr:hypothetical protein [Pseudomonadota bacterium]
MGLPTQGLKSLDRKITEAMALLDTSALLVPCHNRRRLGIGAITLERKYISRN